MGNYSKVIGSVVGAILGIVVNAFGLPAEWATGEIQAAVVLIFTSAATYAFPANVA